MTTASAAVFCPWMSQCETIESRDNLASPRAIRISRTRSRRSQTRARRSAERQRSCRMKTACCSTRPSEASPSTHCWPSTSVCPSVWACASTPHPHGAACARPSLCWLWRVTASHGSVGLWCVSLRVTPWLDKRSWSTCWSLRCSASFVLALRYYYTA